MATACLDGKMAFMVQSLLPIRDRCEEIGLRAVRSQRRLDLGQNREQLKQDIVALFCYG